MASIPTQNYSLFRPVSLASDPTGTFTGGEIYYNSTLKCIKEYNGTAWIPMASITQRPWNLTGALSVANGALHLPIQYACTVTRIDAYVNTPSVGAAINLRVNKNSSSAATLSIAAAENTGSNTSPSISLSIGDNLSMDITQVGSTTAGSDLVVGILLQQA